MDGWMEWIHWIECIEWIDGLIDYGRPMGRLLYFCPVVSSIFFLFFSPILSHSILDVYHTCTHGVALGRI